jgi:mannose-6-phosphate isomerase
MSLSRIRGAVQHYDWGKPGSLNPIVRQVWEVQNGGSDAKGDESKYAEIWLGTHANGPSVTVSDNKTLLEKIEADPAKHLGSSFSTSTANLPYLLKLLSIEKVLSIQSHPDLALAAKLHAANPSVYKDACHKPEMAIALTPFTAMCGFLPLATIVDNLDLYPEFTGIVSPESVTAVKNAFEKTKGLVTFDTETNQAIKMLFSSFMQNFPEAGTKPLNDCIARLQSKESRTSLDDLLLSFNSQFPADCGVFSPLFLAVHNLSPGQSLFVPANTPHAYITGEIIECMARSDNVIRCGLTPKFKDVEVLCDSLSYDTTQQVASTGEDIGGCTTLYRPPVEDFEVRVTEVAAGTAGNVAVDSGVDSGSILLVLDGECVVVAGEEEVAVTYGEALFVSANTKMEVKLIGDKGVKIVRALRNLK